MDRSLNEAARDIGQAIEQLRETMRDKGYPKTSARLEIYGPEAFAIQINAGGPGVFPCERDYALFITRTLGEAYTKADAAIAAMPDRAERAAS